MLNFFNKESMSSLLTRAGFEVVDTNVEAVAKYPARIDTLHVLARRS